MSGKGVVIWDMEGLFYELWVYIFPYLSLDHLMFPIQTQISSSLTSHTVKISSKQEMCEWCVG